MTYNPNELTTRQLPKMGERIEGEITQIEEGTLKDYVDNNALKNWNGSKPDDRAIRITALTSLGFFRMRTFRVPKDNIIAPRSNLLKWKKTYGEFPHVGQRVEFVANEEGYYEFLV